MLLVSRRLATTYSSNNLLTTAVFWAEKAFLLSSGELQDTVRYCSYLVTSGQHQRAARHLEESSHLNVSSTVRYLLATCHAEKKAWEEVIAALQQVGGARVDAEENKECQMIGDVTSAAQVLLGRAYEALGSISEAVHCYRQALMIDIFCVEALEQLYELQALSAEDEGSLLSAISKDQCSVEEEQLVKYLYQSKLRHSQMKPDPKPSDPLYPLAASVDMRCGKADQMLHTRMVDQCYSVTNSVLLREPLHPHAVLLHVACCVSKGCSKELYSLSHDLVQTFPGTALAWYTVGCYYLATNKHVEARRYLVKALTFSPHFSPAHIAFGTTFAREGEHDQAIAAFSNAARCLQGSHLPLLYLGKEYFISGSTTIACSFLKNALKIASSDPLVLHEVGVVLASTGYLTKAEKYFYQAIGLLRSCDPHCTSPFWEPLYNNLGHVLRKQGKYGPAMDAHMRALQVDPMQPLTFTAIAFVYLLQEEYQSALEFCQRSLLLKREDQFTVELMQLAVDSLASNALEPTSWTAHGLDGLLMQTD